MLSPSSLISISFSLNIIVAHYKTTHIHSITSSPLTFDIAFLPANQRRAADNNGGRPGQQNHTHARPLAGESGTMSVTYIACYQPISVKGI